MHYIMRYRISNQDVDDVHPLTSPDNTFILAIDGDVDFKPSAVQDLVKHIKRSEIVAAVCGRIHPTGKGVY